VDRDLGKSDVAVFKSFDFYFFAERHSVAFQRHFGEDTSSEDPHAALRIADPAKVEQAHRDGKDEVADLVFETHGLWIADGEPGSVQKVDFQMTECFEQIRNRVGRIAVVAIESDNDVARGKGKALLVGAAITSGVLADDSRAKVGGNFAGPVRRPVIDNNHFIDERGHTTQDLLDPLLFIEARHDYGDALVVIHQKRKFQNAMRTLALLVSTTLAATACLAQGNAELSQVQTVYVMPMANGFDQYLANRLRSVPQVRVVADAAKADAIFTDKLGVAFEARLDEIEEAVNEKLAQSAPKPSPEQAAASEGLRLAPKRVSALSRGKGTYFLVDRRSRIVLWSVYSKPKDVQPNSLDKNAEKVVDQLGKDFSGKK
jgi:hypothetical protein